MSPTISLCLFGKNEKDFFLKEVLDSALRFVDEIIYCDTGSTDGTVEWLKENYPMVVLIPSRAFVKPTDYTNIRNYVDSFATKEWILATDCDEVFDGKAVHLKEVIQKFPDADCFSLDGMHYIDNLVTPCKEFNPHVWQCRLFKNDKSFKYPEDKMHGLIAGPAQSLYIPFRIIHHYGFCKGLIFNFRRFVTNLENDEFGRKPYLYWQWWTFMTGTHPGQPNLGLIPKEYAGILLSHPIEIVNKFRMQEVMKEHGV